MIKTMQPIQKKNDIIRFDDLKNYTKLFELQRASSTLFINTLFQMKSWWPNG